MRSLSIGLSLSAALLAIPAEASAPRIVTIYAVQQSADCSATQPTISLAQSEHSPCGSAPHVVVQGHGVSPASDPNASYFGKPRLPYRLARSGQVTGTVSAEVLSPSPEAPETVPLFVSARISILVNNVKIGEAAVSGPSIPSMPPATTFAFALPAGLRGQPVRSVTFTIEFDTCAGAPACALTLTGPSRSVAKLPVS
jgi:hypothetical protein